MKANASDVLWLMEPLINVYDKRDTSSKKVKKAKTLGKVQDGERETGEQARAGERKEKRDT